MTRDELTLAELDDLPEAADGKATVVTENGWFSLNIKKGDSPFDIVNRIKDNLRPGHLLKRLE